MRNSSSKSKSPVSKKTKQPRKHLAKQQAKNNKKMSSKKQQTQKESLLSLKSGGTFPRSVSSSSAGTWSVQPVSSTGIPSTSNSTTFELKKAMSSRLLHKVKAFTPGEMVLKKLAVMEYIDLYLRILKKVNSTNTPSLGGLGGSPNVVIATSGYSVSLSPITTSTPMSTSTSVSVGGSKPINLGSAFTHIGGSSSPSSGASVELTILPQPQFSKIDMEVTFDGSELEEVVYKTKSKQAEPAKSTAKKATKKLAQEKEGPITKSLREATEGLPSFANMSPAGILGTLISDNLNPGLKDAGNLERDITKSTSATDVIFAEMLLCVSKPFLKKRDIEKEQEEVEKQLTFKFHGQGDRSDSSSSITPEHLRDYDLSKLENLEVTTDHTEDSDEEDPKGLWSKSLDTGGFTFSGSSAGYFGEANTIFQEFWNLEKNCKVEVALSAFEPKHLEVYDPQGIHKNWKSLSTLKKDLGE